MRERYVRWRRLFLRGVMMRRIWTTTNTGTGGLHFSFLFSREDDALCRVRRSVLVPAFIMTTTKKKTKKNGELNCISNAFCMLVHTSYLPLVLVLLPFKVAIATAFVEPALPKIIGGGVP